MWAAVVLAALWALSLVWLAVAWRRHTQAETQDVRDRLDDDPDLADLEALARLVLRNTDDSRDMNLEFRRIWATTWPHDFERAIARGQS